MTVKVNIVDLKTIREIEDIFINTPEEQRKFMLGYIKGIDEMTRQMANKDGGQANSKGAVKDEGA